MQVNLLLYQRRHCQTISLGSQKICKQAMKTGQKSVIDSWPICIACLSIDYVSFYVNKTNRVTEYAPLNTPPKTESPERPGSPESPPEFHSLSQAQTPRSSASQPSSPRRAPDAFRRRRWLSGIFQFSG